MKNGVSNSIADGENKKDFQLLYIKMTNEQPTFSLERRKQDNKILTVLPLEMNIAYVI